MRRITAIFFAIVLIAMSILPVYANTSNNITHEKIEWELISYPGETYQIEYWAPKGFPYVYAYHVSGSAFTGSIAILYYNDKTIFGANIFQISSGDAYTTAKIYETYAGSNLEQIRMDAWEMLLENQSWGSGFTYTVYDQNTYWTGTANPPGGVIFDTKAEDFENGYRDWYQNTTGQEPPLKQPEEPEPDEGFFEGILNTLKDILNILEGNPDIDFLREVKSVLDRELVGNNFINGLNQMTETISEIFSRDYDRPQDFYDQNPFKVTIDGIAMPSEGGGYWIDNNFNMNLDLFQNWNMRWYFGDYPTMHGAYILMNGKPAGKAIIDPIVSAILWVFFGIGLWKSLTRLLDGDFTGVGKEKTTWNDKTDWKSDW